MLYHTGYITIKEYDKTFRSFILGLPNDEVRYGLYDNLVPLRTKMTEGKSSKWE